MQEKPSSLDPEGITHFGDGKVVLGQGGVNALLKLGSLSDQSHSCPGKLPFIPKLTGWDPHPEKSSRSLELVQTPGIELIRLVGHA